MPIEFLCVMGSLRLSIETLTVLQAPKRRIPKQTVPPLEITKPKQFNNGNIEIIRQETSSTTPTTKKVPVDEVLINGRRYRVPERILVLDFWSKVSKKTTAER